MSLHNCEARTYGDQVACGRCGTTWDLNDDKPACKPLAHPRSAVAHAVERAERPRTHAHTVMLPDALPDDVALKMVMTYHKHVGPHADAMRAAYRVLLDRCGV